MERRLNVTPEALNRLLEKHNMTREEFIAAYGLKPLVYVPELPPSAKVVFLVLYIIIFALALLGNSLVVYIIIRQKAMRTATNIFICSLACSDLLVTFFCIPFTLLQNVSSEWLGAETLSTGASSMPGQRLSQIRRWKKKTQEDMFSELMCTSESDKTELSTWRIALSDRLHNDYMDWRACREHRCDTQDEMVQIMREQTDKLRHLVEVQESQLDTKVPLQPMLNLLPSSPSSTFSSPRHPRIQRGWGGLVFLALNSRGEYKYQKAPIPAPLIVIAVQL